jgi:hypothetical protein
MAPALRAHFEGRFGHDFSKVRVLADDAETQSQNAAAVTRGWEISFAPGRWSPVTAMGRRLLGHELVHVVQQTRPGGGGWIGYDAAEREAERWAGGRDGAVPRFGIRPFGGPAMAPPPEPSATPAAPAPAVQPKVVPAADVERLVQEITRVVVAQHLPGVNMAEVATVLTALREYGKAGKVMWGKPEGGVYGTYDHVTDVIVLSEDRFDINNPGNIAAVTIFHEASHATRLRTTGPAADAAMTAETGLNPTIEDSYRAAINRDLKMYREEVLAHTADQGVMYSYLAELGIVTRERAIELVANADPTKGSSAEASLTKLGELMMEYRLAAKRDVELDKFLRDAKAWAASGKDMPEFRNYLMP